MDSIRGHVTVTRLQKHISSHSRGHRVVREPSKPGVTPCIVLSSSKRKGGFLDF